MGGRTLYQFVLSPYSAKVRWALEWKRLDYDAIEVNPFTRRETKAVSGQPKVPVLVDGAAVIRDSTLILDHLDAAYPDRSLTPSDPAACARARALEDWADEVFIRDAIVFKLYNGDNPRRLVERTVKHHPPGLLTPLKRFAGPTLVRIARRSLLRGRRVAALGPLYERHLDLLEAMPAGRPFLTGQAPTRFDAAVWGGLWSMRGMEGGELLEARPALSGWYERMRLEI